MPNIFSNELSKDAEISLDLQRLRENYFADGVSAAAMLARDKKNLAIWLSGPFVERRVLPSSDLHMCVLVSETHHSFYRHQLAHFSDVGRRLEIAYLPRSHVDSILETGYSGWSDVFDIHKFTDMRVLFDRDNFLEEIANRLSESGPTKLFVGKQLDSLRSELGRLDHSMCTEQTAETVLMARKISWECLKALILVANDRMISKPVDVYPAALRNTPSHTALLLRQLLGVSGVEASYAEKTCRQAEHLVNSIFDKQVI